MYILIIIENTTGWLTWKKKYRGNTYKRMQTHSLKTTVLIHSLCHLLNCTQRTNNCHVSILGCVFLGYVVFQPVPGLVHLLTVSVCHEMQ